MEQFLYVLQIYGKWTMYIKCNMVQIGCLEFNRHDREHS